MKIDSIKINPSGIPVKLKHKESSVHERSKSYAEDCTDKNVNRENYGGSFTGTNRAAATVIPAIKNSVDKESMFGKLLLLCDEHTVIANSLVALFCGAVARPITFWAISTPETKDNNIYNSGHAIASAIIGFIFSTIVMAPFGAAAKKTLEKINDAELVGMLEDEEALTNPKNAEKIEKMQQKYGADSLESLKTKLKNKYGVGNLKDVENLPLFAKFKNIYKVESLSKLHTSESFRKVSKVIDMAPDTFVFGIAKAMLTIALIPPILKYVFGIEKGGKKPEQKAETKQVENTSFPQVNQPKMEQFMGGLK